MSQRRKTSQTTIMICSDEIPESDVHASFLSFFLSYNLFGFFLKSLFCLLDVTLFKTVGLEARDFYRVIVERSVYNSEKK